MALLVLLSSLGLRSASFAGGRTPEESRAIELFERSAVKYRQGQFAEAAALLRQAYELRPAPVLLYNLGRALEAQGEPTEALDAYRRHLAGRPTAADRVATEERVLALERKLAEADDAKRKAAANALLARMAEERARLDAARLEQRTSIPPAPLTRGRRAAPWIVAGLGAVALGSAGALGGLARAGRDEADRAPTAAGAASQFQSAERLALGANIAFGLGGAVLGAGLIWGIVDAAQKRRTAHR